MEVALSLLFLCSTGKPAQPYASRCPLKHADNLQLLCAFSGPGMAPVPGWGFAVGFAHSECDNILVLRVNDQALDHKPITPALLARLR